MNRFWVGFISLVSIVLISMLAFLAYENDLELRSYKKEILGTKTEYSKLQKELTEYKSKVGNLKQLVIVAKSPNSKNIEVSDIIYKYSTKIDGDISIYYKSFQSDESIIVDGSKKYYMASLYKVILTLFILDKVANKELKLEDTLPQSDITIDQALNKVISESNNEYAKVLASEYGWSTIEKAMKQKLGINFNFSENLDISAENVGRLFENIALSLRIPQAESSYILKLLGDQKKISKLPKYLPSGIYSHNKTGEFENYSHDAGIFYTPKANYILVFLSKTKDPAATNEQMALMSKEIYESLNGITP